MNKVSLSAGVLSVFSLDTFFICLDYDDRNDDDDSVASCTAGMPNQQDPCFIIC